MPSDIFILNLPYKPDRRERLAANLADMDLFCKRLTRHHGLREPVGDAGDAYRAFDRFGRLEEVRWQNANSGAWVDHLFYGLLKDRPFFDS